MKNKGLVFSLATLFLILSFLLLEQTTTTTNQNQQETFTLLKAFEKVNEDYQNINENIIDLDTSGNLGKIQQRLLPFKFGVDKNAISLEYTIPIKATTIGKYYDAANALQIFYEDKNFSNYYHNVNATIFAKKNSYWGGTESTLNFTVEPSCMNMLVQQRGILFSDGWCAAFDLNKVQRIDTNLTITTQNEDLNAVKCYWNASTNCPSQNYSAANPNPYFYIKIFDQNCSGCNLATTEVKGHFDISKNNWIKIMCQKPSCVSAPIDINASDILEIKRDVNALSAKINITLNLNTRIESFYYDDFNFSLTINDYNIKAERPR